MTMPRQYAHAADEFDRFVEDLRLELDHTTRHQTYQTIESVLRIFRRRLTVAEAIGFANALPAILRAIFVADWDVNQPVLPFSSLATLNAEVRAFRKNHDFSPANAIEIVATILKDYVDPLAFRDALARLPPEARTFWGYPAA